MKRLLFLVALLGGVFFVGCSQAPDKLETQAPPPGPDAAPDPVNRNKPIPRGPGMMGASQGSSPAAMGAPGMIK